MENKFKLTTKIDSIGTSFSMSLPNIKNETILSLFGKLPTRLKQDFSNRLVLVHDDLEPDKGDGSFVRSNKGIFSLSTCRGVWRISNGLSMRDDKYVRELKSLIYERQKELQKIETDKIMNSNEELPLKILKKLMYNYMQGKTDLNKDDYKEIIESIHYLENK